MPGPAVEHGERPGRDGDLDRAAALVELARVVDQVGDRPIESGPWGVDDRRSTGRVARHAARHLARAAPAHACRHVARQLAEFERLDRLIGQIATGHRHELVHEVGQLDHFGVEIVEDLALHDRFHVGVAPQHRQVGPQAGERRAQLVAGVLHEALLLGARQRERVEHPAERAPRRPTSSLPVPGTSISSRPDVPTSSAAFVRRRTGAVTVPAISQPIAAAATDTRKTRMSVRWRTSSSTASTSSSP